MSETPLLQDRWHVLRVDELGNVSTGGTPPTSEASNYGGDIPFIGPADLGEHRWINSHSTTLSSSGASRVRLAQAGDVIVSCIGILGKVGQVTETSGFNQQLNCISANAKVDQDFLYYACSSLGPALSRAAGLQVVPIVKKSLFSSLKIAVPRAKREQQRIATILSTIDTAIEQTEALIEKYQHIKAGLMHDLFTRGVLPTGQLRPPREQSPELYQETAIGWIPREWDARTLRTACDWYSGGTPSKQNEEWWKGSFPWLSPKDMKRFELIDTEDHVTRQAALVGSRIAPKDSVFIVVRGMILAHSFPVVINGTEFAFNQDVKAVIGRSPLMNRFLAYWFVANTDLFLKKTTESTHGTKRFDLGDLYKIEIAVPSEDEQQRVIDRLDTIERQIWAERELRNKLQTQKLGLMQDLLTGKVSVTTPPSQGVATP